MFIVNEDEESEECMDINLLVSQLLIAIFASAIIVPAVQKLKVLFPAKYVELFSGVASVVLGYLVAMYYAKLDLVACAWVAFFSLIGAEAVYKLLQDKLETYTEKKEDSVVKAESGTDSENGIG